MNLKETYDKIAENWFKDHEGDMWWIESTNKFISFLNPKILFSVLVAVTDSKQDIWLKKD